MNNEERTVAAVNKAKAVRGESESLVTLSTGVKLRLKAVPPVLLSDIVSELSKDRPSPPSYMNELKGRMEENPNDPDYLSRVKEHDARTASSINDALILLGSELTDCPKNFPRHNDPAFLSKMKILKRPVESEETRYLAWVKYIAAPSTDDVTLILGGIGRMTGISEDDVQSAMDTFRSES